MQCIPTVAHATKRRGGTPQATAASYMTLSVAVGAGDGCCKYMWARTRLASHRLRYTQRGGASVGVGESEDVLFVSAAYAVATRALQMELRRGVCHCLMQCIPTVAHATKRRGGTPQASSTTLSVATRPIRGSSCNHVPGRHPVSELCSCGWVYYIFRDYAISTRDHLSVSVFLLTQGLSRAV
jgi:hypothetical protein